jgi:cytochrome c-type biogenesis protein CcmH
MVLALALTAIVSGVVMFVLLRNRVAGSGESQVQANTQVYRDQLAELDREHAQGLIADDALATARDELSRRLLEDTATDERAAASAGSRPVISTILVAVLFPVLGMAGYLWLGQPQALNPQAAAPAAAGPKDDSHPDMEAMAKTLAQKLKEDPNNPQGWVMLGRTYRALQRYDEAQQAYQKALSLSADDDVLLERAEVLAQKANGDFTGEPWAAIRQVLGRDERHFGGLLLAGSASFSEGKFADAKKYWQMAREQSDAGSEDAQGLDIALGKVREKLGEAAPPAAPATASAKAAATAPAAKPAAAGAASVSGRVTVAAALKARVAPGDTVFVYATPSNGERMPLAIYRTTAAALPLDFVLDDSSAMNPQRKISSQAEVMVKVRVSKAGNAMPQAGDLTGTMGPVKLGAKGLKLEISEEIR